MDAAVARDDQPLLINIKGVDMIAKEAKYHGKCRSKYVSKTNLKYQGYKEDNEEEECVYSAAFALLVDEITPALSEGKIYDMTYLLDRYKQVLVVKGVSCSTYRSEKLKRRMRNHFLDQIVIEKQNDRRAEESFVLDEDSTAAENLRELAWFLLRLNRKDVFKANDTCGEQSIPGGYVYGVQLQSKTCLSLDIFFIFSNAACTIIRINLLQ